MNMEFLQRMGQTVNWNQVEQIVGDLIVDHWVKVLVGLLIFLLGRLAYFWFQVREYRLHDYLDRTTFSMNMAIRDMLLIRNVGEVEIPMWIFNDQQKKILLAAVKRARRQSSEFAVFVNNDDKWQVLNAALNFMCPGFRDGTFARAMGLDTVSEWFTFAVSCENAPGVKVRKIRILFGLSKWVAQLAVQGRGQLTPEHEHQAARIDTMCQLANRFWQESDGGTNLKSLQTLMQVEVTMRVGKGEVPEDRLDEKPAIFADDAAYGSLEEWIAHITPQPEPPVASPA